MSQLTHGSLFAGIGGFDLGFERAGMRSVWQVEIDPFCRKVLEKHFPHAERFADIRECGEHNLQTVDVISGGFPCQDISTAGAGAGIAEGTRSGLWIEYLRIIRELRPGFVVVENVAALLARGLGRVLGDLAASGYDAEWDCIPASAIGAPHRRDRVWIVAHPQVIGCCQRGKAAYVSGANGGSNREMRSEPSRTGIKSENLAMREGLPERDEQRSPATQRSRILSRSEFVRACSTSGRQQWEVEPNVGRVANGIPARVYRLRGLGNAIVPQIAEWIGRRIICSVE
jgi:DNA (cytosine-5)-methyltransferase 1